MNKQHGSMGRWVARLALASVLMMACLATGIAQQAPTSAATVPGTPPSSKVERKITPEEAKQLFALVDQLIKFSSEETGLPIRSKVKREITSRAAVETYLQQKFDEDEGAKRMQSSEIVLKKFGLLDRDFNLKPFLLALLKEQIAAYYDSKTKTVSMLDWVSIEDQKPVLAHELTHALQDQHTDLEKWNDQTPSEVSLDAAGDSDHLSRDEMDTAREAVVEGQATAVMMDYILKPMGKSLLKDPEILDTIKQQMANSEDSPILARAPLLLSESLLFPYREGLSFEQDLWMDKGQTAAFTGAMDHPPTSSWEILNPREYEKRHVPAVPLLPNIHPLLDKLYKPYDIGQVGQLDLHILAELLGGDNAARSLTPAWDGGLYWAGQRRSAKTAAELGSTNSIALFYLSAWKNDASAQAFAKLYAENLGHKYSGLKPLAVTSFDRYAEKRIGEDEQVYTTSEGPVLIVTRGKLVFVAESFDLDMARKLAALLLDGQATGELQQAQTDKPMNPASCHPERVPRVEGPAFCLSGTRTAQTVSSLDAAGQSLTGNLVDFFARCGVMKAAVEAGLRSNAQKQ